MPDRVGRIGRGFTNLKRILGRPAEFAAVTELLAKTVPEGHAIAGCDEGSWALVGAMALRLHAPVVLVRRTPKNYFVSYGHDPTLGDGRLAGEQLAPGTPIHLVDDLIYSGETLCAALDALRCVDLDGTTASAIVWTARAEASVAALDACGTPQSTKNLTGPDICEASAAHRSGTPSGPRLTFPRRHRVASHLNAVGPLAIR